jgi:hypothetical protein
VAIVVDALTFLTSAVLISRHWDAGQQPFAAAAHTGMGDDGVRLLQDRLTV